MNESPVPTITEEEAAKSRIADDVLKAYDARVKREYPNAKKIVTDLYVQWTIKHPWSDEFMVANARPHRTSKLSPPDERNVSHYYVDPEQYDLTLYYGYGVNRNVD